MAAKELFDEASEKKASDPDVPRRGGLAGDGSATRHLALLLLFALAPIVLVAASTWLPGDVWRARLAAMAPDGQIHFLTPAFLRTLRIITGAAAGLGVAAAFFAWRHRRRSAPWLGRQLGGLREVGRRLARDLLAPTRETPARRWLVLFVLLAGVGLRAWQLDVPMRHDESKTFEAFVSKPLVQGLSNYYVPNNHVLHTALAHVAWRLGGDHPAVLRLPAWLAGCAVPLLAFALARRLFDADTALLAAALVAVCPPLIDFSVNARGYTLVTTFALLAFLVADGFERRRKGQEAQAPGPRWLVLSAFGALGLWAVPVMLIPLAVIYTWLIWPLPPPPASPARWRRLPAVLASGVAAVAGALVLYSPAIFRSGFESLVANRYVRALSPLEAWSQLPGVLLRVALWMAGGGVVLGLAAAAVVVALLPGPQGSASKSTSADPQPGRVARRLAGALVVGGVGLVFLQRTLPVNRVFLALAPLLGLLVAHGLARAFSRLPHASRTVPALALAIVVGFASARLATGATDALECPEAERIAAAVQRIAPQLEPPLLTATPAAGPMRFYLRRLDVPLDGFHWFSGEAQVRALAEKHRRLLVVERRGTFTAGDLGLDGSSEGGSFTRRELVPGEYCRLVELRRDAGLSE